MLRVLGNPKRACDGLTRRELLLAGGLGLLGTSRFASPLRAAQPGDFRLPGKAKSVICLFLFGGPSQLETFDPKPDAPAEVRGPFKTIPTTIPGMRVCEHLPKLAQRMDKMALLRAMCSQDANHNTSRALTGHDARVGGTAIKGQNPGIPFDWPFFMSAIQQQRSRAGALRDREMPPHMCVPNQLGLLEGYHRTGPYGGFLGSEFDPVCTRCGNTGEHLYEAGRVPRESLTFTSSGLDLGPEMTLDSLNTRRDLMQQVDAARRDLERNPAVAGYGRLQQQVFQLLTSERMKRTLDLSQEPAAVRERYGWGLFGQSVLLSRRLVEAGVPLVTAMWDCTKEDQDISLLGWDTHWDHFKACEKWLLPGLDQALAALLDDLEERGLLDETLIVCFGEMGRTPRINPRAGRDHWVGSFCGLLAGAGIQPGAVYGSSDKIGAFTASGTVSPQDLLATVYRAAGVGEETMIQDRQGRPLSLYDHGRPIRAILA